MSGPAPDEFDQTLGGPGAFSSGSANDPDAGVTVPGERPVIDGRYSVIRRIGAGGMGDVYLAEDKDLQEMVAIKILPSVIGTRKREVERLRQEAKLCRNLNHTNIVSTFTFGLDESRNNAPYLVMQYIDGETLDDELADYPSGIPLETCRKWIEEIASALDYAHESAILHRDIKPSNIMIDRAGRAWLMDFGIARQAHDTMLEVTGRDSSGTPKYMSPQQLAGKNSPSNDIYSFAATVYEMLGGAAPFNSGDITYQIREVPPKPIEGLPDYLNDALLAGLSKDPQPRPQTAMAFAASLLAAPDEQAPTLEIDDEDDEPAPLPPPRLKRARARTKTRTRSRSRSRTASRSKTNPDAPDVVAMHAMSTGDRLGPGAAVGAGLMWAAVAGVGVIGAMLALGAARVPTDPAVLAEPAAMGGLAGGLVLGGVAGLVGRMIRQGTSAAISVGLALMVMLGAVLVITFSGGAGGSVIGFATLFGLAMGTIGLCASSLPDVWQRTGPALLTGVVLGAVAGGAGVARGGDDAIVAVVVPALVVLLGTSLGALIAAGRMSVQGGFVAGIPAGCIGAVIGVATLFAATKDVDAAQVAGAAVVGLLLGPIGGLCVGFLGRYWNPVQA